MSEPIEVVACVAQTPAQAKVFVATLVANGIPARIEGDNLSDEWAASQRLMNLMGTRVMVPTKCLERARELLQPADLDPAELERQALAAPGERAPEPRKTGSSRGPSLAGVALLVTSCAAAVFGILWQTEANAAGAPHPDFDYRLVDGVMNETLRRDARVVRRLHDRDGDGRYERYEAFDSRGKRVLEADSLLDGVYGRIVESRSGDFTVTWVDQDRDGLVEAAAVADRDGKIVQRLVWDPNSGFVLQKP